MYQDRVGEAEGEAALGEGLEGSGVAITFVDNEKFITVRAGKERASHKRGRKPLKEFWGAELLFDTPPKPVLLVLAYMGGPRENPRPVIGDEISLGWVEG